MSHRLPRGPFESIDRSSPISFRLEGRRLTAFKGDTVGSAIAAAGITTTGRSFKYHRPRGLFCMTGACPNCLMTIDGVPNLRACITPLREGMDLRRQNAWPSVDHDLLGIFDRVSFALPAGFYYKIFHRPRFVWPLVEPIIRRVAGLGRAPHDTSEVEAEKMHLHPDVLVIGGGPSGLRAAIAAAGAGKRTVLLEARTELGGRMRSSPRAGEVATLVEAAERAGVDIHVLTQAFGIFEGPLVAAAGPDRLLRIRASEIVVATGAIEQSAVFPNNDLPGIMPADGVNRLLHLYGVLPGRRAVLAAYGEEALGTASALRQAGARVTVIDPPSVEIQRAVGRHHLRAVVVRGPTGTHELACDLLVLGGVLAPASSLLSQAGAQLAVTATGAVTGSGRRPFSIPPPFQPQPGKQFACICMDVTLKEMQQSIEEGFDSMELLKRYTTLSMGPCQGKACLLHATRICAELTHRSMAPPPRPSPAGGEGAGAATGMPTARPPWMPVSLGVLAAGHLVPRKETAMHERHADAGAEFMWVGDWRRPHHYQDPRAECDAVHNRVALIDVSTLGKLRVKGPDAVTLLERLYPSKIADLKVGRIRYGAMLNDQGVILDDGTLCRLADDEFFVTTTTGGTAAIEQWVRWWLADWGLDVQVINVSGAYAAVNLAGPRAREVMERLTDIDVSPETLPYLMSARGPIAGVPALILRIGFVGELGYEIHFPSAYGEHVWDRIMEAGKDLGIAAFGVEAQRILRLEKQHIIVGQDTDALSDPYGAGMGWLVKLDKPDFLGRQALAEVKAQGPLERLVGFTIEEGSPPPEGASVIDEGRPVGRVCSSRWSDLRKGGVGMAWVPAGWAEDGRPLEVAYDGRRARGRIYLKPFHDPEGKRLRS